MIARRRIFLAGLALIAMATMTVATGARAAELWRAYASKEGGFEVLFPGDPKVKFEPATVSSVPSHEFLARVGPIAFVVSYDDYAPGTLAVQSPAHVLDLARDRLVKGQPVKLLADGTVQTGKTVGREVVFQDADGYTQMYRIYVVKDRLYQTITGGPAGSESNPDVLRFHQSFKLTGSPTTP